MEEWRKGGGREMEEEGGRTQRRNGKTRKGSGEDTGKETGARGPLMETEARRGGGGRSQRGLDKG